ncbi:MAG: hypothetical protein FJ221_08570 [Lentisphaerae bacterium]|nr:hypothetical protein [Lentisphaerota bacterium]
MRTLIAFLALASAVAAHGRTWTSASGKTVEADLVAVQGPMVVLKTPDGQRLTIEIQSLSAEDQEFVKSQQPGHAKPAAAPGLPDDLRGPEARAADLKPGAAASAPPVEAPADAKPAAATPAAAPAVPAAAPGPAKPALPTLSRPGSKKSGGDSDVLTEEQIAALQRSVVVDEKEGEKIEFNGGMTPKKYLDKNEKEFGPEQPIPFRLTCELVRVRPSKKGGEERKNLSGTVHFYILDSSGAVILSKSQPVDRMLPKGDSGYRDELPKQGKYTLVMHLDNKGTKFGLKEALNVGLPRPNPH